MRPLARSHWDEGCDVIRRVREIVQAVPEIMPAAFDDRGIKPVQGREIPEPSAPARPAPSATAARRSACLRIL